MALIPVTTIKRRHNGQWHDLSQNAKIYADGTWHDWQQNDKTLVHKDGDWYHMQQQPTLYIKKLVISYGAGRYTDIQDNGFRYIQIDSNNQFGEYGLICGVDTNTANGGLATIGWINVIEFINPELFSGKNLVVRCRQSNTFGKNDIYNQFYLVWLPYSVNYLMSAGASTYGQAAEQLLYQYSKTYSVPAGNVNTYRDLIMNNVPNFGVNNTLLAYNERLTLHNSGFMANGYTVAYESANMVNMTFYIDGIETPFELVP